MALRKRWRLRKPRAVYLIHWILALMPSARALVMPRTIALRMPERWRRTMRATFLIGSSRERIAQAYQRCQAFFAQARRRKPQSCMANSLIAQARAVFRLLARRGAKRSQRSA